MKEFSIKLKIADREYPMKISPDQEPKIRDVGKRINEKLKSCRNRFETDDKQDLLAIVAFECLFDYLIGQEESNHKIENALQKVSSLNHLISEAIS